MAFLGINYLEPAYTSKYGSKPLQNKYDIKTSKKINSTKSAKELKSTKTDFFEKLKKPSLGKTVIGITGAALLIYGIVTGKVPVKKIATGALNGLKGAADYCWKGISLLGAIGLNLGKKALNVVKKPFTALGSWLTKFTK